VQFTIGQDGYDILGRLQTLLRREIPDGDAGAIFERALRLLHAEVEAAKFGKPRKTARKASRTASAPPYENRIRPGADPSTSKSVTGPPTRYISKAVKRAVWFRDKGQCAFVASSGQRCTEQNFLELHHIHPYALDGSATVANISLRCRTHNAHEAEAVFGTRRPGAAAAYGGSRGVVLKPMAAGMPVAGNNRNRSA